VRTTITIDDELFRAYKVRAATLGTTFSQEVEQALRETIERHVRQRDEKSFVLITAGAGSEPLPGVDYSSNAALFELIDEGVPLDRLR
jgi:plasmid stability protein